MNLKEKFSEKFYDGLVKCNFVNDLEEIINTNGDINVDLDDFINISNGEVVGAISQYLDDMKDELIIKKISDKKPTDCILYISNVSKLQDIEYFVIKLKTLYPNLNIITGANEGNYSKIKVQALLTYNSKDNKN